GFIVLSWLGFPGTSPPPVQALPGQAPLHMPWPHDGDEWVAFFTLTLTISTILLWASTASLAKEARDSAEKLISMERPYVTGGGDFVNDWGKELFRLGARPRMRGRTGFEVG